MGEQRSGRTRYRSVFLWPCRQFQLIPIRVQKIDRPGLLPLLLVRDRDPSFFQLLNGSVKIRRPHAKGEMVPTQSAVPEEMSVSGFIRLDQPHQGRSAIQEVFGARFLVFALRDPKAQHFRVEFERTLKIRERLDAIERADLAGGGSHDIATAQARAVADVDRAR